MGSRLPTRQLALSARSYICPSSTPPSRSLPPITTLAVPSCRRHKWSWSNLNPFSRRGGGGGGGSASENKTGREFDSLNMRKTMNESMQGRLQDSIFDEQQPQQKSGGLQSVSDDAGDLDQHVPDPTSFGDPSESLPGTIAELATDPSPRARVRLQRKLVKQMVRRGTTPATREERIARSEREMTFKSPWMATSVKKLGMLARQISGKTVDDALVQMKFSKKKFAREIAYRLREARDVANVKHGMGLGPVVEQQQPSKETEAAELSANNPTATEKKKKDRGRYIQTREGKWIGIKDPTRIYIDEIWVNRGPYRPKQMDIKGRGRFGVICPPSTSISFRLKEEKTRIRIHDEKQAKERARKPWVHLPDRPILGQRPYYSW